MTFERDSIDTSNRVCWTGNEAAELGIGWVQILPVDRDVDVEATQRRGTLNKDTDREALAGSNGVDVRGADGTAC